MGSLLFFTIILSVAQVPKTEIKTSILIHNESPDSIWEDTTIVTRLPLMDSIQIQQKITIDALDKRIKELKK